MNRIVQSEIRQIKIGRAIHGQPAFGLFHLCQLKDSFKKAVHRQRIGQRIYPADAALHFIADELHQPDLFPIQGDDFGRPFYLLNPVIKRPEAERDAFSPDCPSG